jgi:DHA2 family multidrug resistance protein
MISTFMAVLDATITNTALPKIMTSFGISTDLSQWILTSYMLAFAIMLPTSGWIADRIGYKRTYTLGLVLFTSFSFLCGISWSIESLVCMRIGQAIGGGILQPVGMAIIMREFPVQQRGLAMGFWSIAAAASVSLGPMLGGYLVDNFNWHIIFNINVPVGIFCFFATWIIQREYKTGRVQPFDVLGFASMCVFLSFLLIALSSGNSQWNIGGWTSDFMMICYALAIVGLVVFLVAEFNVKHPLVDLRLLGRYNFGLNNLVMFSFGIGMFGSTFLMPLYLQNILGYTALQSGLVFLPVGILQATVGPFAGYLSDKVNAKIPIIIGIGLFTTSFLLNSRMTVFSEHAQIMAPMYLRGMAMGVMFASLSTLALVDVKRHEMAQASGLMNVIRQLGGSFGVAILQTLLSQRITYHTAISGALVNRAAPAFAHAQQLLQGHALRDAGSAFSIAPMQAAALLSRHVVQQMFVFGIDDAFLFSALCTAACIIPILFLKNAHPGRRPHAAPSAE